MTDILTPEQQITLVKKIGTLVASVPQGELWHVPDVGDVFIKTPRKPKTISGVRIFRYSRKAGVQYVNDKLNPVTSLPDELFVIVKGYGPFIKKVKMQLVPIQKLDQLMEDLKKLGIPIIRDA